jgi:hypothetical protein
MGVVSVGHLWSTLTFMADLSEATPIKPARRNQEKCLQTEGILAKK